MSRPFATTSASAALAASLACGSAAAVEAIAGTQLVMHVGPGAEHPSFATVPAEARLTVHGCIEAEGWCLVRFGGRHGWIEGDSLAVVGFSRPPQPAAAPAAQQIVVVPVPFAPELPPRRIITADDVVIGVGEQFGFAAFVPRTSRKVVDLKMRHRAGLAFKRHGFKPDIHLRRHGHFKPVHLDRRGFHPARQMRLDRLHFRKPGARFAKDVRLDRLHFRKPGARFGKELHIAHAHFVKPGRFLSRGKRIDHGLHFGKRSAKHRFVKRGKAFGRPGKVRFLGHRVKGGWRP